ncbi:uncharacterized protein ARMOST_15948 [Armillaria ostoyae]|uniref:Uncharacterized protein n=1 Tax=Armillaria ostoyae TaxID=47428 RepID=A0A284RUT6_ARMOS|nr:uncharacterized protein ARMOST_15948 [Armillaria ostoyae]
MLVVDKVIRSIVMSSISVDASHTNLLEGLTVDRLEPLIQRAARRTDIEVNSGEMHTQRSSELAEALDQLERLRQQFHMLTENDPRRFVDKIYHAYIATIGPTRLRGRRRVIENALTRLSPLEKLGYEYEHVVLNKSMHNLIDCGTAYHRTHLDLPKQRLLERYHLAYFDAIHDGSSELWWQEFIEIYTEEYPHTVLNPRFTSQARYEESVRLLREVLEQWMDVRGGRIAKLTAYYSADHWDTKHDSNDSNASRRADVLEMDSPVHSEREDHQSDGIQHATTGRILQWRAGVAEAYLGHDGSDR